MMASGQERLKLKRTICDTWSTKEQLCLASSVLKSGDQNWMSVSRCLKSFLEKESQRPPDWFSQKSCAVQYAHLLENSDTPKRKKKECTETTGESIVKRLTQERMTEIGHILASQRDEYQQLKSELNLFKTGNISEEKLQKMCLQIELDEREQEQKGRAHSAWLAKRQKQDAQTPASLNFTIQRKSESSDGHDTLDPCSTDEEDKKNKGGRSPLLTSLLKSPSPTTQIQAQTSSAQVTSPTIASLLGSSPKIPNPQLTQTVSPQLHQLVSTAIANATPERPSAGAPTLSMLLELPANLQRNTLPNLQHHASTTNLAQQNINLQMMQVENQRGNVQLIEPSLAPGNLSASEIIDHIDKVIPKDIMADVMDKDEINEIIGDIEELIKGEIIQNPQALDPGTARVMETLIPQPPVLPEKQEIKNVPAAVSLADSPESEVTVEEIDSSSSNIAEIIGTVAVEESAPQDAKEVESKSGETVEAEISAKSILESKNDKAEAEKSLDSIENSKVDIETRLQESQEQTREDTTKSSREDVKKSPKEDPNQSIKEDTKNSIKEDLKKPVKEDTKKSFKEDLRKPVKEDTKKFFKEDIKKPVKEDTKKSFKEDLKKPVKEDPKKSVKEDPKKSVKEDPKKPVKEDPKKPVKEDPKKPVKEDPKKPVKEDPKKPVKEDPKKPVKEDPKKTVKDDPKKPVKEDPKKPVKEDPKKTVKEDPKKPVKENPKKPVKEDPKKPVKDDVKKSPKDDAKKETRDTTKKEVKDNLKTVKENSKKETKENVKENVLQAVEDSPLEQSKPSSEKENSNEKVSKEPDETHDVKDMDQLEVHLAKITGDEDASCTEVLSVSSDDHPSAEDTEKSQDISLILEDEVISPILQEKEKEAEEISVVESLADGTEYSASSKEDAIIKEESGEEEKKESLKKAKEESKKVLDLEKENSKKEDKKDFSGKTLNTVIEEDSKDLEKEERENVEESEPPKETDDLLSEDLIKDEEIKLELTKEVDKFQEETLTQEGLKNEKEIKEDKEKKNIDLDVSVRKEQDGFSENVGELDEEESTLSKMSGGRVMKTYSKRQTIAVDSEPEIEGSIESADYRAWKKAVMLVYNRLATHKYASAFLRPITEDQAPGYHSIIFRPMDLSTIKKNIDNGTIRSTRHFQRDVMLMFQNAIMYNKHDTFVYKMAITMQEECLQHMQILVQVTGEMSFRRETRTAASSSSEASESGVKRKRSHITPSPHDTDIPRGKKRRKSEND